VTATLTTIGSSQGGFATLASAANRATIYTRLVPVDQRSYSQEDMMSRARQLMKAYPPRSAPPYCKPAAAGADRPTSNT